ncbi:HdeD family acid-resistance protein [Paraburkholderia terrae]
MHNLLGHAWWMLALRGAAGFTFGVLALALPGLTLTFPVALYAAYAIVGGVGAISGAVRHRGDTPGWWAPLPLGLCSAAAGVIAILLPTITALVLIVVMGINAIATGVFDLITAFRLRVHIRGAWPLHLSGFFPWCSARSYSPSPAPARSRSSGRSVRMPFSPARCWALGVSAQGWLRDGLTGHPSAG